MDPSKRKNDSQGIARLAKRAKLDDLQAKMRATMEMQETVFQAQNQELERTQQVLGVALKILFQKHVTYQGAWEQLPQVLRDDPSTLVEAILSQKEYWYLCRENISEYTLAQALPILLENHRHEALQALENNFLKWEEVNPLPDEFRQSWKLSALAFKRGAVVDRNQLSADLPDDLLIEMMHRGNCSWDHLPLNLKNDVDFCRKLLDPEERKLSLYSFKTRFCLPPEFLYSDGRIGFVVNIAHRVFPLHESLLRDVELWECLLSKSPESYMRQLFEGGFLPRRGDLLRQAVQKFPVLIRFLQNIEDDTHASIVAEAIQEDAKNVIYISRPFFENSPEYYLGKLANVQFSEEDKDRPTLYNLIDFGDLIPLSLWDDDNFVKAWFQSGLPLLHEHHPHSWMEDREKLFLVAKHCPDPDWLERTFRGVPEDLRNNVEFISQLMEFRPDLFQYASQTLQQENYELLVWAMGDRQYVQKGKEMLRNQFSRRFFCFSPQKLQEHVERACAEHTDRMAFQEFYKSVTDANDRPIGMLSVSSLTKKIRDFVGIPRKKHWHNLVKALGVIRAEFGGEAEGNLNLQLFAVTSED